MYFQAFLLQIEFHHLPDKSGPSVLALDDIYLMEGACKPTDPSCTFRLSMCKWQAQDTGKNTGFWRGVKELFITEIKCKLLGKNVYNTHMDYIYYVTITIVTHNVFSHQ